MKIYLINPNMLSDKYDGTNFSEIDDTEFKEIAIKFGEVYSYEGFIHMCFHEEHLRHTDFHIRMIE